ncbi:MULTISPECIES: hypothetical protein [unclassified Haloferax]|uniref:hypothetical protein n=1 Tax=unclassified Haloferax TaxID=2625095 RepID=UPI00287703AC|nr:MULTISPECIES: hypothetical protein [unclassified Haloferax]MDS0243114.1 hypothetical protein [Haloferax sp. S2CR25]MDS0446235.1 hypothetical protein [Haloferax sp. S2CR25-2]
MVEVSEQSTDNAERAEYDEVADALFETLAALEDIRERLDGGAKRSGVPPEQVINEVWDAYDLGDADEIFSRTGHERVSASSPEDWAFDERVPHGRVPDAPGGVDR